MHSPSAYELRNNPEYLNFLSVGRALQILVEGLRPYAEEKAKELQELLLKKKMALCKCGCHPGKKPCHHRCEWGKALKTYLVNPRKGQFHQSNSKLWHEPSNGFWEIAKVFMHDLGTHWQDVKDPDTTDLNGIINFLLLCKYIKIQAKLLTTVKEIRNELAHTKSCRFSMSEKNLAFDKIENLLKDPELLSHKEIKNCQLEIDKVKSEQEVILTKVELEILQEISELQRENDKDAKQQQLLNIIKIILSSQKNIHPAIYQQSLHNSKGDGFFLLLVKFFSLVCSPLACLKGRCCSKMFLILVFLISVNDYSVFVPDYGCSRSRKASVITSSGFEEFDFTSRLSHKREDYFGRSWFFRELGEIFRETNASNGVLITGDPGSGKSALMAHLICSSHSNLIIHDNIVGYHLCDYSEKGKQNGGRFVRNLVNQIAGNLPEYAAFIKKSSTLITELNRHCYDDPTACFFSSVVAPLYKMNQFSFKYIVIDALDECVNENGKSVILDIIHHKISSFPKWLKLILTSRNDSIVTSKIPRTVERMVLNPRDEKTIEDIRKFISRYLRKKASFVDKLQDAILSLVNYGSFESMTNDLTVRAEGNYLFAKTVLQNNLEKDGVINLQSLPNRLHDIYHQLAQRYLYNDNSLIVLFEVLLACGSLPKNELFEVLQHQKIANVRKVIDSVSSLLYFGERVGIYHHYFAEWLTKPNHVRDFSIKKSRGHKYMADFLLKRPQFGVNIIFNDLKRISVHIVRSGELSDEQEKSLRYIDVTKIRNPNDGKCILHVLAGMENAAKLLTFFLSNVSTVDILDHEKKTPIYLAASKGYFENVRLFLDKGSCVNCIFVHLSTLRKFNLMLQMEGSEQLSAIHVAVYKGHADVVEIMLKYNYTSLAKLNKSFPSIFHLAAERGHLNVVKMLHRNHFIADVIALHHAVARNHYDIVEYLLETVGVKDECLMCKQMNMSNFNDSSSVYDFHYMFCETSLHTAVSKRLFNITELLLKFSKTAIECKHHSGKTPLMDAVERNDTKLVELLLKNGANIEEKCGREVSLQFRNISRSRYFFGKKFLYTLYREKTSCSCGNKVLHLCAKYGLWHMARYLINNWNASVLDKNCEGETVWKIANVSHNEDFIYHVNRMLLTLDEKLTSTSLGMAPDERRNFKKLLKKFFMRSKPYQLIFECDSSYEGMSPLHIAAFLGVDTLNRVYAKAHEIAPSLPFNCTNKHWITPKYLAHLYDSIRPLTDKKLSHQGLSDDKETALQYPDREAELHIMFNYFFHSPSPEENVLEFITLPRWVPWDFDVSDCPGFYDLIPESKDLELKPHCSPPAIEEDHEKCDMCDSSLQNVKASEQGYCYTVFLLDCEDLTRLEQRAKDCFCPLIMSRLHNWFTRLPKRQRRVNTFISQRMGWKYSDVNRKVEMRWPVYFLYKKIKNEYSEYKYLNALNEGFRIHHDEKQHD